jgi:hypothetical protein
MSAQKTDSPPFYRAITIVGISEDKHTTGLGKSCEILRAMAKKTHHLAQLRALTLLRAARVILLELWPGMAMVLATYIFRQSFGGAEQQSREAALRRKPEGRTAPGGRYVTCPSIRACAAFMAACMRPAVIRDLLNRSRVDCGTRRDTA